MVLAFIFILGLVCGSFLDVLANRLPRGKSVVEGRSQCDHCKHTLQPLDLIPLVSFLWLRGRCRYCRKPIGWECPLIELLTAMVFAITYLLLPFDPSLLYALFIVSCLIIIVVTDIKYGLILNKITYTAIIVSLIFLLLFSPLSFFNHLFAGIGGGLFFLLLFLITRGKGMGLGDVKFAFLMGLVMGYPSVVLAFYIAFLTGAIIASILIIYHRKKARRATIPFGPFLAIGTLVSLWGGERLVNYIVQILLYR